MEYLKDILIKESTTQGEDKVFIVHNLPKNLLYTQAVKRVPQKDKEGLLTGEMVGSPDGEKEEVLLEGIERNKWDGAFRFPTKRRHVKEALDNIDRYIDRMFPRDVHPPERINYAEKRGDTRSNPIARHKIPVVDIPLPQDIEAAGRVSPSAQAAPVQSVSEFDAEKIKAEAIKEYKEKQKEKMAKVRAARAAKKASK